MRVASAQAMAIVKSTAPALQKHGLAITTAMYARLFESMDRGAMAFQPGRAGSPDADRLQASVVELVSRYPTSARIAAMAANFACRTTDSDSYRRYRAGFVGQELDYWITPSVKACDHQHGWTVQKTAAKSAGK